MKKEFLILVDDFDTPIGKMEKMQVHEAGLLHRAFSVFLFNSNGELLMQQRADEKYHSGGLWTNTCCSHPQFGEEVEDAIARRLPEEMGINTLVFPVFNFIYKSKFENGLTEHEFDHIFIGITQENPIPNPTEVKNWKFADTNFLMHDIKLNPHLYTTWFRKCLPKLVDHFTKDAMQTKFYPPVLNLQ